MNLGEYRARVRRMTGLRLDTLLTDADLDATLNEVYREIAGLYTWPQFRFEEDVTVAAGVSTVTLPFDVRMLTSVVLLGDDHARLRETTSDELDRVEPGEQGVPVLYAQTGTQELEIYPAPDVEVTLQVRGHALPAPMVADTDTPEFEVEFHTLLAYVASARLLGEEGDQSGRIDAYSQQALDMLDRAKDRYLNTHDRGLFVMGGRGKRNPRSRVWV